jgi:hypothetical protein
MMDDAEARRWLTSTLNGADALTDDLIREGARLLADMMDAARLVAKARKEAVVRAVARSRRCDALWEDFKRRHGLTVKRSQRSPKDTRGPGEPPRDRA